MGRSERDVLNLLAEVYEAGLGERSWSDALQSIQVFFDAAGAVAFDLDRGTGAIPFINVVGIDPMSGGDYADRMNAINPRMKRALSQSGCHTSFDYEALPEEAIKRHEFYDWLTRQYGIKYFVGSRMIDSGDVTSFVSVEYSERQGHAEADTVALFEQLTPHFANAWDMSRRCAQNARVDDFNALLLESVPWGAVTLDQRGRVLSVNSAARAILERNDGLRVDRGVLKACYAAADRSLQIEIGQALKSACGEGFHAGGKVSVARSGGGAPYGVQILPTRYVLGPQPANVPYVAVLVSDPLQRRLPSRNDLMSIFGLTPREAEAALYVAQGLTRTEIVARMGVAPATLRVHLANAMAKTQTRRETALASLILGLPCRGEPI